MPEATTKTDRDQRMVRATRRHNDCCQPPHTPVMTDDQAAAASKAPALELEIVDNNKEILLHHANVTYVSSRWALAAAHSTALASHRLLCACTKWTLNCCSPQGMQGAKLHVLSQCITAAAARVLSTHRQPFHHLQWRKPREVQLHQAQHCAAVGGYSQ